MAAILLVRGWMLNSFGFGVEKADLQGFIDSSLKY
jgi:hypothetical protein